MRTPTSFGSDQAPRHRPAAVARPLALGGMLLGTVLLAGCAADQPSGPLAPRDSTASQPLRRVAPMPPAATTATTAKKPAATAVSTTPAPSSDIRPAPKPPTPPAPAAAAKPAPVPAPVQTAAKPALSPAAPQDPPPRTVRPPTPAATTAAPVATRTPAPPEPRPTEVSAPQSTRPTVAPQPAAPSATVTGDFSTALLFAVPPSMPESREQLITLCEFKSDRWTPVMTAPVQLYGDTRAVSFRGVPAGRMVVPMYMVGDNPYPAANPWMIESTGKVRELKGPCATCPSDEPPIMALELRPGEVGQKPTSEPGEYGVMAVRAEPYRRYTLDYWDAKWIRVGEVVLGEEPARIGGVPGKRILWLNSPGGGLTLPIVP